MFSSFGQFKMSFLHSHRKKCLVILYVGKDRQNRTLNFIELFFKDDFIDTNIHCDVHLLKNVLRPKHTINPEYEHPF